MLVEPRNVWPQYGIEMSGKKIGRSIVFVNFFFMFNAFKIQIIYIFNKIKNRFLINKISETIIFVVVVVVNVQCI